MNLSESPADLNIAFIHDWLTILGGAERVLTAALELYPSAPIYTLVHDPAVFRGHSIVNHDIIPSLIDRLPWARRGYRFYLPLMPFAVEQFDLRSHDLIISSSDAVAHGVLPAPDQLHINYIYTPARYAWRLYHQYLEAGGLTQGIKGIFARIILHYIRLWDFSAAARVDEFVAISRWVARSVWRAYRRTADVIYPPVEIDKYKPLVPRDDYYIVVSRLVPYKKIPLIVEAFRQLGRPLIIIGDGPDRERIGKDLPSHIQLLGWQTDEVTAEMLGRARAFIHMAEEDFGIAPIEAQAAGCPVIAYGRGGVTETVIEGKTGLFFLNQSAEDLIAAVIEFEQGKLKFEAGFLQDHVRKFSKERFKNDLSVYIARKWDEFSNA